MNFRKKLTRILTRKLAITASIVVIAVLVIAVVAVPAGAINQVLFQPAEGEVLNAAPPPPPPVALPFIINYQGYLTDDGGNPINDTLEITFSIYEVATEGTPVWTETQSVILTDGLFNVLLGSINPIYLVHLTGESYLGVTVGGDDEMSPRQQIVSVAYAHRSIMANWASNAGKLDGMDSADFVAVAGDNMTGQLVLPVDGLVAGTDQLVLTGGKVGIRTDSPTAQLDVQASTDTGINVSASSTGIYTGGSFAGVHAESGSGAGVRGWSSDGIGVEGKHETSGNYGMLGTSDCGVYGKYGSSINQGQLGTYKCGVYGYSSTYGVYGDSGSGEGVYGTSDSGYGVSGNTTSGYGVVGTHSGSGNYGQLGTYKCGVYGLSSDGYGVWGYSNDGYGVYGYNYTDGNYGMIGTSDEGVYGKHAISGNYGKLGTSSYGVDGHGEYGVRGIGDTGVLGVGDTGVYGYGSTHDFYAGGTGTYGPFTGSHEVKFTDDFPEDIRPGMIVSLTGENQVRTEEGEISYSSTLPDVQLSDTPNDKKVLGVIISESPLPEDHWYQSSDGERFGIVNALGEGRVWVTNINGDIETGDYITTSAIAGYGQKQNDDLLHAYTLGKAAETIEWSQVTETVEFNGQTYKAYPIAVVYTSG